jgi:pimeloyl-ACP methyl ester carboxylesterase
MAGVCSSGYGYLQLFQQAARAHGGALAIEGDRPCHTPGDHSFTWDPRLHNARIEAALTAAGATPSQREGLTLVGYSAGAGIGAIMVMLWPARYPRVVLIASPADPEPGRLARARAVVTMSCSLDVPGRMKEAARRVASLGVPSTYLEMPGCTHGELSDGERLLGMAFDWLAANAPDDGPQRDR